MNVMGGTCSSDSSSHRHGSSSRHFANRGDGLSTSSSDGNSRNRRYSRHSVVAAVPDESIFDLYPLTDNFVLNESTGLRSPKSLAELCTDTLCRSLPLLGGEGSLPPGLPQDVVDDVVRSLMNHSALNATTLRVLKNCELTSLSLAKCRGVTDEWLESLNIGADGGEKVSAIIVGEQNDATRDAVMEAAMDIYDENNHQEYSDAHQYPNALHQHLHQKQKRLVFHNASLGEASSSNSMVEEASCSTSSFVSASSVYHNTNLSIERSPLKEDHPMLGEIMKSPLSSASNDSSLPHDDAHMSFTPDYDVSVTSTNSHSRRRSSSITTHMTLLDLRGSHQITDKGLLQLDDLSSLEVAKLDGCFSIQGRGLMAMSMSNRLHSLSLANCRRLTDEAIINISHLVSLETLSLDGCRCLTDRSLVALASLICLKKLDLSQCDLITDGGLENLGPLECIEELSLGWCRTISDTGVKVLCNQSGRSEHLRVLSLARTGISDDGLESLTKLQAMEELDLNGCSNVSSSCLGNVLAKLPKMTSLDVSYCPGILRSSWQGKVDGLKRLECCYSGVRDSHLSKWSNLPALQELSLDSCPVSDWSIAHLADNSVVPNLTSLDLADTDLSDHAIRNVTKFKNLKRLSLFFCNITNSSLRHLSTLTSLEVLNLDSREISDTGLVYIVGLPLKSLDIFSGRITDAGCHHISKIKTLECLELCGGTVTDTGCTTIASSLQNLTSLNLSQNERITNRGAAALAALSKLQSLNLSHTSVNSEALIHFSNLRNLQSLAIYGCRGMDHPDGNGMLERLQSGLPNLKCVRINNGTNDDGVLSTSEEDTDEEDFDFDTEQVIFSSAARQGHAGFAAFQFEEHDSDSAMDDAANIAEDDQSDSSYSNHDY